MRTTGILHYRLLAATAAALVGLTGLTGPAPATAAPAPSMCEPGARTHSPQEINLANAELRQAGMGQRQVDQALFERFHLQRLTKESNDTGHVDSEGDASIEAVSTGSDVDVFVPAFYIDGCGKYYVMANYAWKTLSRFRSEHPLFCNEPCALSGNDGFGIAFNRNLDSVAGYSMLTWGAHGGNSPCFLMSDGRTWPETGGTVGVIFEGVDHSWLACGSTTLDDYDFYHGSLTYNIGATGCGTLQAFSRYTHTWSNVNITGASIGYLQLGFSWSSSSDRWAKASQPSSPITPC